MSRDNDKIDELRKYVAMGEEVLDMLQRHKDTISAVSSGSVGGVDISDTDIPVTVNRNEEKIVVTVLANGGGVAEVGFTLDDDVLELGFGGKTVTVEVPEDADIDNATADMNNGVLTAEIPRDGGDE